MTIKGGIWILKIESILTLISNLLSRVFNLQVIKYRKWLIIKVDLIWSPGLLLMSPGWSTRWEWERRERGRECPLSSAASHPSVLSLTFQIGGWDNQPSLRRYGPLQQIFIFRLVHILTLMTWFMTFHDLFEIQNYK